MKPRPIAPPSPVMQALRAMEKKKPAPAPKPPAKKPATRRKGAKR